MKLPAARPTRAATAVAVGLVMGLVAVGCSGSDSSGIVLGSARRGTVVEVVEAPATVAPKAASTVASPADGRIQRLRVRDGAHVRAGELVAIIDSPSAERALRRAKKADAQAARSADISLPTTDPSQIAGQADAAAARAFRTARKAARRIGVAAVRTRALAAVARAAAQYAAARADASAAVERFNSGLGTLGTALGSLANAQRVQTSAAVVVARRTVKALKVRAPISGTVTLGGDSATAGGGDLSGLLGQLPAGAQDQAGALLGGAGGTAGGTGGSSAGGDATGGTAIVRGAPISSGTPLVTVTDVSSLSLQAEVDETDVLLVHRGVQAGVELDALPGARYTASVSAVELSPATGQTSGGVAYRVTMSLGAGHTAAGDIAPRPRPGMSAVADLHVRTARNVVSVPAGAIVRDRRRDAVWIVEGARAHRRSVTLGAQGDTRVQVREGLELGDRVVVRGADKVTEDQQVP